jgi:hypothetical protein
MIPIIKTLAHYAVQRLVQDPELRAKAVHTVKSEVVPRAKEGWQKAKPQLEEIRDKARNAVKKVLEDKL